MGQVTTLAVLSNFAIPTIPKKTVKLLVDTGAALVGLTPDIIEELQLLKGTVRTAITANGKVQRQTYLGLQITIQNRTVGVEVSELPFGTPLLLGYIALESLDLRPNLQQQILMPEHDEFLMNLL